MFQNAVITDICPPFIVHSKKGREQSRKNRGQFGLSLCLSGQITYTMGAKEFISIPGYGVLLPKGASYQLRGDKEGFFPLINFQCDGLEQQTIAVFPLSDPQACYGDFEFIRSAFQRQDDRLQMYSIFYNLLHRIDRAQHPEDLRLSPALDLIQERLGDPGLSNQDIADRMGISEIYLRKLFHTRYQTTPKQYVLQLRLQKAKQLLQETSLNVTQIAELCGFSSVYHFCRAFKEKMGVTPSQFSKGDHLIHM